MDAHRNIYETRRRALTERGKTQFDAQYKRHRDKYELARVNLLQYIAHIAVLDPTSVDKQQLSTDDSELSKLYEKYYHLSDELCSFLIHTRTDESDKLLQEIQPEIEHAKVSYDRCTERILDIKLKITRPVTESKFKPMASRSVVTDMSHSASMSSSRLFSSMQAQSRAKAEAAKAKLAYTKQEAELRIQQAIVNEQEQFSIAASARKKAVIEAELKLLSDQKEIAEAVAEADTLDKIASEGFERQSLSKHSSWSSINDGHSNSLEHVREYVLNLNVNNPPDHVPPEENVSAPPKVSTNVQPLMMQSTTTQVTPNLPSVLPMYSSPPTCNNQSSAIYRDSHLPSPSTPHPIMSAKPRLLERDDLLNISQDLQQKSVPDSTPLNPLAKTFVPTVNEKVESSVASEIGQFFLKKELLISRLNEFNDKPENYDSWKASFKRLVTDLKLTSSDELEMLGKWLGPKSKKYAESVRNSNMNDPDRGVKLLWERLDSCYGTPEEIEASLLRRLNAFEPITHNNPKRYYDFVDLSEIESLQRNARYREQLAVFNTSSGVTPVAKKILPYNVYEKWMTRASNYKQEKDVVFPPFSEFVVFAKDMCRIRNDPSFTFQSPSNMPSGSKPRQQHQKAPVDKSLSVKVTDLSKLNKTTPDVCPIHSTKHTLNECRTFRSKPIFVRRKFLKDSGICFGCCMSKDHQKSNCPSRIRCIECKDESHPTALHIKLKPKDNGGEPPMNSDPNSTYVKQLDLSTAVTSKCTEICGDSFLGKSCSKIVLVRVYHKDNPSNKVLTYAILDEQSNQTLARSHLFRSLNINGPEIEYTLNSCSGLSSASGHIANDCVVESFDGVTKINLPPVIECDNIPENREEIPTPSVAASYSHLRNVEPFIPPLQNVPTLLLIGRDLGTAHHVLDQKLCSHSDNLPYAQKLRLGWVIVGESCLGKVHKPNVTANKTHLMAHGRPSIFPPCENNILLKENDIGKNVFIKTADDNKVGMSVEDKEFFRIMDSQFEKSESGHWQAPLPFRPERQTLPNNRSYTLRRAINLHNNLIKDVKKREDMVAFIGKMFERGHAEVAPPLNENEECWYLPVFGVYHPRKPGQVRAVFDSSAQYAGISLNSVLLSGPDLNNSLLVVLMRFRKDPVAVTADIEQMFHSFLVREEHRNFLRFFWYESNDPTKPLIEYRMKVHLFGNSPSPAVACYGLRKTADNSEQQYGSDVKSFVYNHFYVDDGLISLPSSDAIIDLIERAKTALMEEGKLRLHKFASNSAGVMQAFAPEDLAKDLKDFDFDNDSMPVQRSLGLVWNLQNDSFTFRVTDTNKPYTRRGILSVINSLYDPLGIAAPVMISGKLFLRQVVSNNTNWDDPLPEELEPFWNNWKDSLFCLEDVSVPRRYTYGETPFVSSSKDLLIFSDASEDAIAAVAYIRASVSGETTNFVIGKAKVAPSHGHSLPRLELCAAVLAVELYDLIVDALCPQFDSVSFHTDSRVVLGYINNRVRRFFMYVSNRVERIHQSSLPQQWKYIPSERNPADCATRALSATDLQDSLWLRGPILCESDLETNFPLIDPDSDNELKPEVTALSTRVTKDDSLPPLHERFQKFSEWTSLLRAISCLLHIASTFSGKDSDCHGWHSCASTKNPDNIHAAKVIVLRFVQRHAFSEELEFLESGKPLLRNSPLRSLDPYLDEDKLIRIGGRLSKSNQPYDEKFPIVLPKNHHVSQLLVRYYHNRVHHQGRHITQGALRSAGFWIIGEKRLISSVIHHCIKCKKLRGKASVQKMADLPDDRLTPAPPFTYVGIDVFGPWNIVYRRTRGSIVNTKRWAVLFTCLAIRAVHIEVIEEMSSSSFINALRRFISVQGPVKELRSDRGSNFIGAVDDLKANAINVEDTTVTSYLNSESVVWKFNPSHSSHMGGVWERMIGVSRRILDSLLSGVSGNSLTHEVLVTFMCEVMAIVNSRPIVPVSSDPNHPCVLSPSVLLTQKTGADTSPFQNINPRDMYKAQWKRVQCLAERFWKRWSSPKAKQVAG